MWVLGTLILFAVGITAIVIIGWMPRAMPSPPLWDIPALSGIYTSIVGTLAGFSVASAISIASLENTRSAPEFATVIGMLLIAFLILVFSALMYASIPNVPDPNDATTQSLTHVLANMCGCLGLAMSWLALVPLLDLLGLPALASAFTVLLLFVALAASGWVALFAYRLTLARATACLALPVLGFALPALFRLGVVRLAPALWPDADAVLIYAFIALGVAGLILNIHMSLLLAHGGAGTQAFLQRSGHRVALASSEAYALAVALTWFGVAMP